jgi:Domain of unknown function (DUF6968)
MTRLPQLWTKTPPQLGTVVARRVVTLAGEPNRRISLSIGMPRRVGREEWQAPIRIEGLQDSPIVDSAPGIDSLQALLLAVGCIRWHLKRLVGYRFSWLGGSELVGIAGIPLQVAELGGREFEERIERAIKRAERDTRKFRAPILRRLLAEGEAKRKARGKRGRTPAPASTSDKVAKKRKR